MKKRIRILLWKILGMDYFCILNKLDYTLLKNDIYSIIGKKSYDNGAKVWRWTKTPLIIGNFCSIANNVNFIVDEGYHSISTITNFPLAANLFKDDHQINGMDKKKYFERFNQREGIKIGNDVWIGMGVYIMPGISIGNGVTIAANSVVTKDIEDYNVVAGSPARVIKKKFCENYIAKLNDIAWWNWDETKIKDRIEDFYLPIEQFIEKYSN